MMTKISPSRTSKSGGAYGADQAGLLDLRKARRLRMGTQKSLGTGAEQLPDVAADEFGVGSVHG